MNDTNVIKVSPTTFRQNFGDYINNVHYRGLTVIIEKSNKVVGTLISFEEYKRLKSLDVS
jgi:prevent-host-death family protein